MDISIVIPAYNEEANIRPLVEACREQLEGSPGSHEIVIVNDGSSDGTGEVLDELASRDELIRPIHHRPGENIGCHPSELVALKAARGDVMMFLPADLQIHPSVLPAFLEAAESADIVASHRVERADSAWRRVLSAINNRVEQLLMSVRVRDAHSSMLLTRRAVDAVVPEVVSNSALIPAEILARAAAKDLHVSEIEIEHRERAAGTQTGAKLSEIVGVQLDMFRLRRRLRREAGSNAE